LLPIVHWTTHNQTQLWPSDVRWQFCFNCPSLTPTPSNHPDGYETPRHITDLVLGRTPKIHLDISPTPPLFFTKESNMQKCGLILEGESSTRDACPVSGVTKVGVTRCGNWWCHLSDDLF